MAVTTWSFTNDYEEWTFVDASTPPGTGSATRAHDAVTGSIENHLILILGTFRTAIGENNSPTLTTPVVIADTIALDFSAVQGGGPIPPFGKFITAFFTDATSEQSGVVSSTAGTLTHVMTVNKTLDYIEVRVDRGAGAGAADADHTIDLLEVRLTTVTPLTGTGQRPLGIDVDLENGDKIYTTYWDGDLGGDLMLREYSSALVLQNTHTIANNTATIIEINNRTFFLSPYTPPFFGTASLDDIVYIYGRWDDGAVNHVAKSTDGGASFTDIGDSATWLTGWCGGFFADDANTLYAFINGASRALFRSLNGGTSWTNLSTLPFDVDPHAVSKHPDGRILIANRINDVQMAAYAVSPNYSSWTNATGSPAFPTAGAGARSVIWVT